MPRAKQERLKEYADIGAPLVARLGRSWWECQVNGRREVAAYCADPARGDATEFPPANRSYSLS